ncbi:Uncharacterised protein [Bordetella pertussis]|nr:Uncharacterised protein [Bordetella pertussis]
MACGHVPSGVVSSAPRAAKRRRPSTAAWPACSWARTSTRVARPPGMPTPSACSADTPRPAAMCGAWRAARSRRWARPRCGPPSWAPTGRTLVRAAGTSTRCWRARATSSRPARRPMSARPAAAGA